MAFRALVGVLWTFHSADLVGIEENHVAALVAGDFDSFGTAGMEYPKCLPQGSKPALCRLSLCTGVGVAPSQQAESVAYTRH